MGCLCDLVGNFVAQVGKDGIFSLFLRVLFKILLKELQNNCQGNTEETAQNVQRTRIVYYATLILEMNSKLES